MNLVRSLIRTTAFANLALTLFFVPKAQAHSKNEELSEKSPVTPRPVERRPRMQGKYLKIEVDGPPGGPH